MSVKTWRIGTATNKITGEKYDYEYRDVFGKRYYTFDSGETSATTRKEARRKAEERKSEKHFSKSTANMTAKETEEHLLSILPPWRKV